MVMYEVSIRPVGCKWTKQATYKDKASAIACAHELFRDYIDRMAWFDVRITRITAEALAKEQLRAKQAKLPSYEDHTDKEWSK